MRDNVTLISIQLRAHTMHKAWLARQAMIWLLKGPTYSSSVRTWGDFCSVHVVENLREASERWDTSEVLPEGGRTVGIFTSISLAHRWRPFARLPWQRNNRKNLKSVSKWKSDNWTWKMAVGNILRLSRLQPGYYLRASPALPLCGIRRQATIASSIISSLLWICTSCLSKAHSVHYY